MLFLKTKFRWLPVFNEGLNLCKCKNQNNYFTYTHVFMVMYIVYVHVQYMCMYMCVYNTCTLHTTYAVHQSQYTCIKNSNVQIKFLVYMYMYNAVITFSDIYIIQCGYHGD